MEARLITVIQVAVYLLMFQVEFSSLDFLLHTNALLSTINYVNSAMPSQLIAASDQDAKKEVENPSEGLTGECRTSAERWCVSCQSLTCRVSLCSV